MTAVLLTVTDQENWSDKFIVEARGDEADIRPKSGCLLDADRSAVLDIPTGHCESCRFDVTIADEIGLNATEVTMLSRWRTRKQDGISSADLGRVLDKVVKALSRDPGECRSKNERFVLKVELL